MKNSILKKIDEVNALSDELKAAKSFIIFEYKGINAADNTKLRFDLFKNSAKYNVYKNNILKRALIQANMPNELVELTTGPNAVAIGNEDEIAPIKIISELSKALNFIKIKGAYIENNFLSADKVASIAAIPGRDGLYSMFLSCLNSPITKLACAIKAVADKNN